MLETPFRRRLALLAAIAVLLVGTTMPGSLKGEIEGRLWHLWPWSASAHFVLFGVIAAIPAYGEGRWRVWRALALGIFLALLTEWLQGFAPDRHPSLRDALIDLCGTISGLAVAAWMRK